MTRRPILAVPSEVIPPEQRCETCGQPLRRAAPHCGESLSHASGELLRALITRAGISQVRSAQILGVDPSTLRRWLSGAVDTPYWACRLLALEQGAGWPFAGG